MVIFQPDRFLLKQLVQKHGGVVKGRMLDIGAGEVDRYARFFDFSERITTDTRPGSNVDVVASADALPFPDASFDSIVCTQVLEHVTEPKKVVEEMYRLVKAGGVVLATIPQTAPLHEEPHDYYRYTRYGITHLFEQAGFHISALEQEGGIGTMLAQIRIRYLIDRYGLYSRPFIGRVASRLFRYYAYWMMRRDAGAGHPARGKYTLGYIVIARKGESA